MSTGEKMTLSHVDRLGEVSITSTPSTSPDDTRTQGSKGQRKPRRKVLPASREYAAHQVVLLQPLFLGDTSELYIFILPKSYVTAIFKLSIYEEAIKTTKDSKKEPEFSSGADTVLPVCGPGEICISGPWLPV